MPEAEPGVDLERALVDLGRRVDFPPTPDVASRIGADLATGLPHRRPTSTWQRVFTRSPRLAQGWQRVFTRSPRLAQGWQRVFTRSPRLAWGGLLVAAVLVLAAALLAGSPAVRTAVAERLGLRGVSVEQVPALPASPSALAGAGLDLGEPTTLDATRTGVDVLVPILPELGQPDAVYLARASAGNRVGLVYAARPGLPPSSDTGVSLLVLETRTPVGGFDPIVVRKSVGPNTRLEDVLVNGARGVWLEGAPHLLFLPDASGQFHEDQVRLAGNVLLWEQAGLLLRLEGGLSRDQALQIAASVR